ncbi:MerR family transcriptional regulator [Mogibacterium sp. NSJ-24]|uniref:MerR family transcriptional regulator n=1 Tax=Lentihominibacter hominis TaxID=2763645 RepID=A0A926EAW3_9FIRM|nr:MerR family transcriptional regulator [Lentihominibacter hominis]MBC8568422.1 MerR family transcriptional regulator [Lentihominibacter hominis]
MKKYFSISAAAKKTNVTSETLRHYDRIGLLKPSKKDERTNYRYYSEEDIIRLNTICSLQKMDLPLKAIKEVLEYDDLNKVIDFLTEAEKKADEKIADLQYSKQKIQAAKADYKSKLQYQTPAEDVTVKYFTKRVIMLSDNLKSPALDNLWNYLKHFYDKIDPEEKQSFLFEDLAGVYTENGISRLFALCIRYGNADGLKILPEGYYLCSSCNEENRIKKIDEVLQTVKTDYHTEPEFIVQQIIISGILQWHYQIQVYLHR